MCNTGPRPVHIGSKGMKGRTIIPLVLGLAIGAFALKMFVDVLKKAQGATGDTVSVVRARAEIPPTLEITEQMVEVCSIPRSIAPKQGVSEVKEVIGRVTGQLIPQGMPVVASMLAPKGTLPGMAARIPDGYRAVAVKVDEVVGVAGWLKPKSRVDVVAVMSGTEGGRSETISRVILQNVEVLAVGQDIGNGSGEEAASVAKSVTLLVKPDAVPKLHLASTKGTIRLAMRNQNEDQQEQSASMTDNDLLGLPPAAKSLKGDDAASLLAGLWGKQPKPAPKATDKAVEAPKPAAVVEPAKPSWAVEVWAGPKVETVRFDGEDSNARLVKDKAGARAWGSPAAGSPTSSDSPLRHAASGNK